MLTSGPISVVVPTRDRPAHLRACLEALASELRAVDELIVVDSASTDPTVADIAVASGARVARCDRPGASGARNAGVRAAMNDLIVFVDDDVRVQDGWLEAMADALAADGVAFVCGRVAAPVDQEAPRPVAVTGGDEEIVLDRSCITELGNSANLGVHRDAFDAVGGFDEVLGAGTSWGAEDHDLFDRLLGAGYTGRTAPRALGLHDQWRTRPQLLRLDWRYGLGSGARVAKLLRTDRRRAFGVLRAVTWRTDFLNLLVVVRARQEFAILTIALRLLGTLAGIVVAATWRIEDGHFRRR